VYTIKKTHMMIPTLPISRSSSSFASSVLTRIPEQDGGAVSYWKRYLKGDITYIGLLPVRSSHYYEGLKNENIPRKRCLEPGAVSSQEMTLQDF
jgi:hypothetical protein